MACYPCIHCNKCGMFSKRKIVCKDCGTEIPDGEWKCPKCGSRDKKALPPEVKTDW